MPCSMHALLVYLTRFNYRYAGQLYCALISMLYWLVYYPGILAVDSVYQYREAVSGHYADWHPPVMAYALSLVLELGGHLSWLILVQMLAGFFGAFALATAMGTSLGLPKRLGELAAFGITFLFSTPLTPFSVYLATFWKDTWLLILLLWSLALLFMLGNRSSRDASASYFLQLFLLIIVLGLLLLVRHNAIVIYPAAAFALWLVLGSRVPWAHRVLLLLCPLLLYLGFIRFQYSVLKADRAHIEYVVYQVDLVSMVVWNPSLLSELPYMTEHMQGDWRNDFIIGDSGYGYIYLNDLLDNLLHLDPTSGSVLAREYRYAVTHFPLAWLSVKTIMFLDHLQPYRDRYLYNDNIEKNEFGISFNSTFLSQRSAIFRYMDAISSHPWLRWISFVHLPWLTINFALVIVFFLPFRRHPSFEWYDGIPVVMAIPLTYYLSFLLAITFPDFRFMYPATGVVQILALMTLFRFGMPQGWIRLFLEFDSQSTQVHGFPDTRLVPR